MGGVIAWHTSCARRAIIATGTVIDYLSGGVNHLLGPDAGDIFHYLIEWSDSKLAKKGPFSRNAFIGDFLSRRVGLAVVVPVELLLLSISLRKYRSISSLIWSSVSLLRTCPNVQTLLFWVHCAASMVCTFNS